MRDCGTCCLRVPTSVFLQCPVLFVPSSLRCFTVDRIHQGRSFLTLTQDYGPT